MLPKNYANAPVRAALYAPALDGGRIVGKSFATAVATFTRLFRRAVKGRYCQRLEDFCRCKIATPRTHLCPAQKLGRTRRPCPMPGGREGLSADDPVRVV